MVRTRRKKIALLIVGAAAVGALVIAPRTPIGSALLRAEARRGNEEMADALLLAGADANGTDAYGWTAAHWAARRDQSGVLELLLRKGADPNAPDIAGYTPLHCVAMIGSNDCARVLLDAGANVNQLTTLTGRKPWQELNRWWPGVEAEPNRGYAPVYAGKSPLDYAALMDQPSMVDLLLEHGGKLGVGGVGAGWSGLTAACEKGLRDTVISLLSHGVDVAPGNVSETPLEAAARGGHRLIVEMLLDRGAAPTAPEGWVEVLSEAVHSEDIGVLNVLLERGGRSAIGQAWGPLFGAASRGDFDMVTRLLAEGAPVRRPDVGPTALHVAARAGDVKTVRALLDAGADPNADDGAGSTPLDYARRAGNDDVAGYLEGIGARPGIVNDAGKAVLPQSTIDAFSRRVQSVPDSDSGTASYAEAKAFLESVPDSATVTALIALCKERIREFRRQHPDGEARSPYEEKYVKAWMACLMRLSELGKAGHPEALETLISEMDSGDYDAGAALILTQAIRGIGLSAAPRLEAYQGKNLDWAVSILKALQTGEGT